MSSEKCSTLHITPRTYKEEETTADLSDSSHIFLKHSLQIVVQRSRLKWHARLILRARWARDTSLLHRKRRIELVCEHIEPWRLRLLKDTVTEISFSSGLDAQTVGFVPRGSAADGSGRIYGQWYSIREDPLRIRYPPSGRDTWPSTDYATMTMVGELAPGVHLVHLGDEEKTCYVFKEIARPMYEPHDTIVLEQELLNLKLVHGQAFIVQLTSVVTSPNPYNTDRGTMHSDSVIRGFLLQYHPSGTLDNAFETAPQASDMPWQKWAFQLASGLQHLHDRSIAHMDLKPSNVVFSAEGDAVLIDISGLAFTHEWLSPELRHVPDPCGSDLGTRFRSDLWALGMLLAKMASHCQVQAEKELLQTVATLIHSDLSTSLPTIVARLRTPQ